MRSPSGHIRDQDSNAKRIGVSEGEEAGTEVSESLPFEPPDEGREKYHPDADDRHESLAHANGDGENQIELLLGG